MPDPSTYRPAPGSIPDAPGVYRFRDAKGRVIYVGKAKSLRARLSSYFQNIANLHERTARMVTTAGSVEWTVVQTEVEALQLEYSWIKEFDPRFNVKYRDDKSYPWLAVTLNEEFPRVMVGRGAKKKGVRYFGPVLARLGDPRDRRPAAAGVPDALVLGGRLQAQRADRPALPARLHRQVRGAVRRAGHRRGAPRDRRRLLLVHRRPDQPAHQAARARDEGRQPTRTEYERAARMRDDIGALTRAMEQNAVVLADGTDADVIAVAEDPLEIAVQVFYVRGGRVRGQRGWVADRVDDAELPELLGRFLIQVYDGEDGRRRSRARCSCPEPPDDVDGVTTWLSDKRGSKVSLRVPQRGDKRTLMETVARNAQQSLALHKTKRASDLTTRSRALEELQEALGLPEAPLRIECYDVSNLQGTEVVASMVVFEDGLPRKSDYRRFVIRGVDGQNDVAAMHETITRRFRRLLDERAEQTGPDLGETAGGARVRR